MNRYYIILLIIVSGAFRPAKAQAQTPEPAQVQQPPVSSDELLQLALKEARETRNYGKAIEFSRQGLELSPGDADLRALLAGLYAKTGDYAAAASCYRRLLEAQPNDTTALYGLAAAYFETEQYDSTLAVAERGLAADPSHRRFLNLQAGALEKLERYRDAAAATQAYIDYYPEEGARLGDYTGMLRRKSSMNQAGLTHLQSFYDNGMPSAHVTSFQYRRSFPGKSTFAARLNYAQRQAGDGVQLEMESYITHGTRYYSYAQAGWSNQAVFPQWRLGYSLYRNMGNGWEAEAGGRLLRVQDITMSSATLSAGKYFGSNWLNLRGYLVHDGGNGKWHQSYVLTGRHYLNDKQDFLALLAGTGTSPDDRSRNFQYHSFSSFISQFAGAGYQKTFGHLTTASLYGTWNRYKTGEHRYLNQYDITISLYRNF